MKKLLRRPTRADFEALEFPPPEPRHYWTAKRSTKLAAVLGIVTIVEFFALWLLYNPEILRKGIHPAIIPWFQTQYSCEESGRAWDGKQCVDYDHDHLF